ncbi:MAG: SDR family oxidoreductase [Pseudomonadota bacterium]
MPRLFCFGLGYSARALARRLMEQGWSVAGTSRTAQKCAALNAEGFDAHLFSDASPMADPATALAGTTHVLSSIAPSRDPDAIDPVLSAHGDALAAIEPRLSWVGYLSTTSVYGDRDGAWTDEQAPLRPTSERGERRVKAERVWQGFGRDNALPVHCFRLAGIYGPGRSAIDQLRSGTARRIDKQGQVFNRIHVDDIATILIASMQRPRAGAVYNCADDEPAPSSDVMAFAAQLLGVEPPPLIPFDEADISPMARGFYSENKRTDNWLMKSELGVSLAYPNYRAGLRAQLSAEQESGGKAAGAPPSRSGL